MGHNTLTTLLLVLLCSGGAFGSQDAQISGHEWLNQLAGEWVTESELVMEVGKPPVKAKGTESARSLGGLWILSESTVEFLGNKMIAVTTFGYDREKKRYVGTFIASMSDYLWKYDGTLDKNGTTLVFEAEGPNPMKPGKLFKFRDEYEIKGKDHKVLRGSIQMEDGKWMTFATTHYRRKK